MDQITHYVTSHWQLETIVKKWTGQSQVNCRQVIVNFKPTQLATLKGKLVLRVYVKYTMWQWGGCHQSVIYTQLSEHKFALSCLSQQNTGGSVFNIIPRFTYICHHNEIKIRTMMKKQTIQFTHFKHLIYSITTQI